MATDKIRFLETKYTHFYHDLRVFICGVETSEDIRDRISVSISDNTAPNTATIILDNALDKYVFTAENQAGVFANDPYERYNERAKFGIVNRKLGIDGKFGVRDIELTVQDTLSTMLAESDLGFNESDSEDYKVNAMRGAVSQTVKKLSNDFFGPKTTEQTRTSIMQEVVKAFPNLNTESIRAEMDAAIGRRSGAISNAADISVEKQTRPSHSSSNTNPFHGETGVPLYAFDVGDLVLGKHDTIVVYAHNPLTENDEWYPVFTGFINTATESTDETTGESNITLQCYCIRAMMKSMRVSLNAALAQSEPDLVMQEIGYFSDIISDNKSPFTTFLTQRSLEECVALLVTGNPSTSSLNTSVQNANPGEAKKSGVGRFLLADVVRYPASQASKAGDVQPAWVPNATGTDVDAAVLEHWHSMTVFGRDANFITFDEVTDRGQNSFFGGVTDPWTRDLLMLLPATGTNVHTLSRRVVDQNKTQYQFTNRWEIIKDVASKLDYQFYTSPNGDLILEFPMYDFEPADFGPSWKPVFSYFGHLMGSSVTPETESVPTGIIVTGQYVTTGEGSNASVTRTKRVLAYSRTIAGKYGTTDIAREDLPFLTDIKQIAAYAVIMYQRMLANASTMSFTAAHRPFMMPNRPILHERRNRLGMSYAVENTWEIGGVVSTEISIRAIRKRVNEDGELRYRFVTGGTNMGITLKVPRVSAITGQTGDDGEDVGSVEINPVSLTGIDNISNDQAGTTKVSNADFKNAPANLDTSRILLSDLTPAARAVMNKMASCTDTKVKITSGRRDHAKNAAVGGAKNSKHLTGDAFDISMRTGKPGSSRYNQRLTPEQKQAMIDCALKEGYDVDEETQESGPHLHCEPAQSGRDARHRVVFNGRADAANKARK